MGEIPHYPFQKLSSCSQSTHRKLTTPSPDAEGLILPHESIYFVVYQGCFNIRKVTIKPFSEVFLRGLERCS